MSEKAKPRHFRCDCGDPAHSLYIDPDWWLEDDFPYLSISLTSHPSPLFDRVNLAFKVLFNRRMSYIHEVVIHRDDVGEFVNYIKNILPETEGTR